MSKKRLVTSPRKTADGDQFTDEDDITKDWKYRAKQLHEHRWRLFEKNEKRTASTKKVRFTNIRDMFH